MDELEATVVKYLLKGAKLCTMTQSLAYRAIRE